MWTQITVVALLCAAVYGQQGGVGFNAYRTGNLGLDGSTIAFDQTTNNLGNLYVPTNGVFTCATIVRGLYHFQLSIQSQSLSIAEAQLIYTSNEVETVLGTVRTGDGLDSATLEVDIECGVTNTDSVFVRGVSGEISSEEGKIQNTFSGFGYRRIA